MWTYVQLTGRMYLGSIVAVGYAGRDEGKNNPAKQTIPFVGPIPVGVYTILPPVDTAKHGPYVLWLEPDPTNHMFGRSAFGIHGDNIKEPGAASDGCIILPRFAREAIWHSDDHLLEVISGLSEFV